MKPRLALFGAALALLFGPAAAFAEPAPAIKSHGLSAFGDLKYGPAFKQFDYVNGDAPKGGSASMMDWSGRNTFDSLNAFILKGDAAGGIENRAEYRSLLFDSLMIPSRDEPDSYYGLLAETVEYPPDRRWILFTLREGARFHDGSAVTAADVAFSVNVLKDKGHPSYRLALRDVETAEALGPRRARVVFKAGARARTLSLLIASLPVFSARYYKDRAFDESTLEPPLGSGPYRIEKTDPGHSITYRRNPSYWGRDLPARRGTYNFDVIRFEYFRDRHIALEAFKAGVYDFREEFTAKSWAMEYTGPRIEKGVILREAIPDSAPAGVQAFFLNTRRAKFADARVREALDHAFDYEWTNKTIFYGAYRRNRSIFEKTPLAHRGRPSAEELRLLAPWRGKIPDAVFERAFEPPMSDGSGNNRANLRRAQRLLEEAGYRAKGGALIGPDGKAFTIEFLAEEETLVRLLSPYIEALRQLGVGAAIRRIDAAEFESRCKTFDFDIVTRAFSTSPTPGPELRDFWGSANALQTGSFNYAGVRSPAADALIEAITAADTRAGLTTAARALDRVIMHGRYVIPAWHNATHRIAYRDKFGRPKVRPAYSLGFPETWWADPAKEERAKAREEGFK